MHSDDPSPASNTFNKEEKDDQQKFFEDERKEESSFANKSCTGRKSLVSIPFQHNLQDGWGIVRARIQISSLNKKKMTNDSSIDELLSLQRDDPLERRVLLKQASSARTS